MTTNDGNPADRRMDCKESGRGQEDRTVERKRSMTPEYLAELRRRLADGTYFTSEVGDTIARESLRRGDV